MTDFWKLGAAELAAAYAGGQADPVAVVAEARARIARIDPALGAFVTLAPDLDRQAAESAARLAECRPRSALEGVPVAVKDNLSVAGMPAAWGSAALAGAIRKADELPIARLRAAGAILLGKTNTPEFAVEGYTSNATYGATGNPWEPALTPGGSSGGTVAAVAAGLVPLGIGTDGGGSIRRPSGHTGLYGLKPTLGAVARGGGLPQILLDFEVIGPVARTVSDLRLAFDILAGADRRDPASRRRTVPGPVPGRLRILHVTRFGQAPTDPQIRDATEKFAERLRSLGHDVIHGTLPLDLSRIDAHWGSLALIGLAHLQDTLPGMEKAGARYLEMAEQGRAIPATQLFAAFEAVRQLRAETSSLFDSYDLILTPTAAAQPWPRDEAYPPVIDGQPVGPRGHAIYTGWVNASGHPAIALPAEPDRAGLPIGVQLVGDLFSEGVLLDLAEVCEAAGPGWRWPALAGT